MPFMKKAFPKIRRRPRPWAPWSEWYQPNSVEELDDVLLEEYQWGENRCAEHQQEDDVCPT